MLLILLLLFSCYKQNDGQKRSIPEANRDENNPSVNPLLDESSSNEEIEKTKSILQVREEFESAMKSLGLVQDFDSFVLKDEFFMNQMGLSVDDKEEVVEGFERILELILEKIKKEDVIPLLCLKAIEIEKDRREHFYERFFDIILEDGYYKPKKKKLKKFNSNNLEQLRKLTFNKKFVDDLNKGLGRGDYLTESNINNELVASAKRWLNSSQEDIAELSSKALIVAFALAPALFKKQKITKNVYHLVVYSVSETIIEGSQMCNDGKRSGIKQLWIQISHHAPEIQKDLMLFDDVLKEALYNFREAIVSSESSRLNFVGVPSADVPSVVRHAFGKKFNLQRESKPLFKDKSKEIVKDLSILKRMNEQYNLNNFLFEFMGEKRYDALEEDIDDYLNNGLKIEGGEYIKLFLNKESKFTYVLYKKGLVKLKNIKASN